MHIKRIFIRRVSIRVEESERIPRQDLHLRPASHFREFQHRGPGGRFLPRNGQDRSATPTALRFQYTRASCHAASADDRFATAVLRQNRDTDENNSRGCIPLTPLYACYPPTPHPANGALRQEEQSPRKNRKPFRARLPQPKRSAES